MIDKSLILKEIAQLRDIVNLGVCVGIYQTCNGKQFKHMPASDFINFLNLKLDKAKVHPLPRQKQRICYMLFAVSHTIALSDSPRHWIESMLELCDISPEYYDKHHKDFLSVGVSEKNKEYKEIIDESTTKSGIFKNEKFSNNILLLSDHNMVLFLLKPARTTSYIMVIMYQKERLKFLIDFL